MIPEIGLFGCPINHKKLILPKYGFIGNQIYHLIDQIDLSNEIDLANEIDAGNYIPVLYLRIAAIPPKAIIS